MAMNSKAAWPSIAVFLASSFWGLYWMPLYQMEAMGLNGAWSSFLVYGPVLLCFLPIVYWQRAKIIPSWKAACLAGFFTGTALAFYGLGLVYSSVVRATLLFYLTPIWSTLAAMIWLREPLIPPRWVAIAMGLTGLYLMLAYAGELSEPLNIGDLFGLLSGITWGLGATVVRSNETLPALANVFFQFIFATLTVLSVTLLLGEDWPRLSGDNTWGLAILIGMATAAFMLIPTLCIVFWAAGRLSPGRIGILMMSEVVVAIITAALILGERLSGLEMIGAGMIISAGIFEIITVRET